MKLSFFQEIFGNELTNGAECDILTYEQSFIFKKGLIMWKKDTRSGISAVLTAAVR